MLSHIPYYLYMNTLCLFVVKICQRKKSDNLYAIHGGRTTRGDRLTSDLRVPLPSELLLELSSQYPWPLNFDFYILN